MRLYGLRVRSDGARLRPACSNQRHRTVFDASSEGLPIKLSEHDWSAEEWSQAVDGDLPPGVLTGYGWALRRPARHIHWANTETATLCSA